MIYHLTTPFAIYNSKVVVVPAKSVDIILNICTLFSTKLYLSQYLSKNNQKNSKTSLFHFRMIGLCITAYTYFIINYYYKQHVSVLKKLSVFIILICTKKLLYLFYNYLIIHSIDENLCFLIHHQEFLFTASAVIVWIADKMYHYNNTP